MTYAITGISEGLGPGKQVPPRRKIDEWWFSKNENDMNQRSLFLYALQQLMALDPEKEKLKSYFAIAGETLLLPSLLVVKLLLRIFLLKVYMVSPYSRGMARRKEDDGIVPMVTHYLAPGIGHTWRSTSKGSMRPCLS